MREAPLGLRTVGGRGSVAHWHTLFFFQCVCNPSSRLTPHKLIGLGGHLGAGTPGHHNWHQSHITTHDEEGTFNFEREEIPLSPCHHSRETRHCGGPHTESNDPIGRAVGDCTGIFLNGFLEQTIHPFRPHGAMPPLPCLFLLLPIHDDSTRPTHTHPHPDRHFDTNLPHRLGQQPRVDRWEKGPRDPKPSQAIP